MRGQTLHIRPIEASDRAGLADFLQRHGAPSTGLAHEGLIGKLIGDPAAVLFFHLAAADGVSIDDLFVAPDLRRKQIGRFMVGELEKMAARMQRNWLVIDPVPADSGFLRRLGFIEDGCRMVRRVARD